MAELSDPRIGTLLEGRYRLDQRLAAGGMGVVYKGELVAIGKPVAIKFLHDALAAIPDLVKRFQREATAMSKLAHPNLVSVLDSGLANGVPFLVMDFVSGRSLADVLAGGALPATRAAGLARQILAGVRHAHATHVVHRDLKPDNIILLDGVEGDFAKILDFGLAKVLRGDNGESAATQLTNTGFALGTPGYMSPEQARGDEADERTDLYAVGVILYHMVTGRKPFLADSPLAVMRMHMDDTPAPPTQLAPRCCSPELERVILRAMAKEPGARWQTAGEFGQALAATPEGREAVGSLSGEESAARRPARPRRKIGWSRLGRVALLLVVATAVALTWGQLSRRSQQKVQQKVKRRLDDAVKMAEGAYQSAKEGAREAAKSSPLAPPLAPPPKETPPKETPPSTKVATPTPTKLEAAPTPTKPEATPTPTKPETTPTAPPTTPPLAKQETPPAKAETPPAAPDDDGEDDTVEEPVAPKDTPGAKLEEAQAATGAKKETPATPSQPKEPSTREAARLIAAGRVDAAIQTLYAVRRHSARNAEAALLLGHAYFKKLWRTDGLREYDNAIKLSTSLRWNQQLVRNTVTALEDPTYRLARAVIKARIGRAALTEVRHLARTTRSPRLRARATRLAQQLARARR